MQNERGISKGYFTIETIIFGEPIKRNMNKNGRLFSPRIMC